MFLTRSSASRFKLHYVIFARKVYEDNLNCIELLTLDLKSVHTVLKTDIASFAV